MISFKQVRKEHPGGLVSLNQDLSEQTSLHKLQSAAKDNCHVALNWQSRHPNHYSNCS